MQIPVLFLPPQQTKTDNVHAADFVISIRAAADKRTPVIHYHKSSQSVSGAMQLDRDGEEQQIYSNWD